jgi:predicted GIY-YIG superfamily endonuclease
MALFVYILASKRNGTLYIGYTDDLSRRMVEHKSGALGGFTAKHSVNRLVWFEVHEGRGLATRAASEEVESCLEDRDYRAVQSGLGRSDY